jgi:hypothetical protein
MAWFKILLWNLPGGEGGAGRTMNCLLLAELLCVRDNVLERPVVHEQHSVDWLPQFVHKLVKPLRSLSTLLLFSPTLANFYNWGMSYVFLSMLMLVYKIIYVHAKTLKHWLLKCLICYGVIKYYTWKQCLYLNHCRDVFEIALEIKILIFLLL